MKWDNRFLSMAALVATWSKDPSTQTGAVIVRPDHTVVSVGFNGFSRKTPDVREWYENRVEKYSRIIHSEINALIHARGSVDGCTLYGWPYICCDRCCVQMIQAGIVRIVGPLVLAENAVRWADAFERTRQYCKEAGVELTEMTYDV